MAKKSWYIKHSELDDQQYKIIQRKVDSSLIVGGCAGSGKTVLALWAAKELENKGENYLIIVFTLALKQFIRDGIDAVGLNSSRVMHYAQWRKEKYSADYIIVDECQDFDEDELMALIRAKRKHIIFFGDTDQQLYKGLSRKGRMFSFMGEFQEWARLPMDILRINHRLPKKIARIAEKVSASREPLVGKCYNEGVDKPRLVSCNSFEEELKYIRDVIRAKNYTDVGILLPTNSDVKAAKEYFDSIRFGVEAKIGGNTNMNFINLDFSTDIPKLLTYHSAKGLQFEAVFLPMCKASGRGDRNPLFVALTRTYRDLFILYSSYLSDFIEEIDKSLFDIRSASESFATSTNDPFNSLSLDDLRYYQEDDSDDLPF